MNPQRLLQVTLRREGWGWHARIVFG